MTWLNLSLLLICAATAVIGIDIVRRREKRPPKRDFLDDDYWWRGPL